MATFVRNHPTVEASTTGSTVATALSAAVPVGNTLVATVIRARNSGPDYSSSLSKPGGESASWVLLGRSDAGTADALYADISMWAIKTTVGWSSGQTVTATWAGANDGRAIGIAEFSGVTTTIVSEADASGRGSTPVTATTTETLRAGDLAVMGRIRQFAAIGGTTEGGTATGTLQAMATSTTGANNRFFVSQARLITGSGGRSVTDTASGTSRAVIIVGLRSSDLAPDTPTLTSLIGGGTYDRALTNRAGWVFSSANAIDNQSAFDLRYRKVGDTDWTVVSATSTASFYDFAAGALAAGNYEWQVRVYGALGKVSSYSASGYFTMANTPSGPSIIYPISGQSVEQFETATWSTPVQDAYRLRQVADNAGAPNPAVVYYDSGVVNEAATRSLALNFSTNNRAEHIQVQVEDDGLWSAWVDVAVNVSYTPPPVPTRVLYVDPSTGSLLVVIANPTPTGGAPAAVYNDVYIDDGAGFVRVATGVSTNGSWRYWTPISGRDYTGAVRVVAVAANGTTSSSS